MTPSLLVGATYTGVLLGMLAIACSCSENRVARRFSWTAGLASLFFLVPSLVWVYLLVIG